MTTLSNEIKMAWIANNRENIINSINDRNSKSNLPLKKLMEIYLETAIKKGELTGHLNGLKAVEIYCDAVVRNNNRGVFVSDAMKKQGVNL
jgi:hypothetical protein